MKILVTGGAGFIGSHLCDRLVALGHEVVAADNFVTGFRANVAQLEGRSEFRLLDHDVTKPITEDGWDAILHLASPASPVGYARYPIETMLVNSVGTYRLLEQAQRCGARFLLASTSEVYGDPLEHPQVETYWGNVNPVGPRACYDEGKRFAEALTVNYVQQHGVDARIVRIFNTYGPRNHHEDGRVIPTFIRQALRGEPITVYGDGAQTRSFCYVSDLVEGIVRALVTPEMRGEIVNLGMPREHSVQEIAQIVKAVSGSTSAIVNDAARPEEIARRCPNIEKARRLLGWEPIVSLEDGLRATVDWLRAKLALERGG